MSGSHRRIVQYKTAYYSFYLSVSTYSYNKKHKPWILESLFVDVVVPYVLIFIVFFNYDNFVPKVNSLWSSQVACALLMAGKDLNKHVAVKDILVQMGIYYQIQVGF